jgi:hypothetical protein
MARGRAAIDALLVRPERASVAVTHGNLMTLILRSFETQFGFQTWERLSNPDVYCLAVQEERVEISRTWALSDSTEPVRGDPPVWRREEAIRAPILKARNGAISRALPSSGPNKGVQLSGPALGAYLISAI